MKLMEGKGKRDGGGDAPFEFCEVCNLNHNHGRKHRYFPNHIMALSRFLSRFQDKLSQLRLFLKNPSPIRPEHAALNRLWCVFCDAEIVELGSSFVCFNAIRHLASSEHLKKLKNFMWKYGGGMDRVPSFVISEADLLKWEKKCEASVIAHPISSDAGVAGRMSSEDIHNLVSHTNRNTFVENSVPSFEKKISPIVQPLQSDTIDVKTRFLVNDMEVTACSSSSSIIPELRGIDRGESSSGHRSNPPWLEQNGNGGLIPADEKDPSKNTSARAGRSRKLNPNRVGAAWAERRRLELEMERRGLAAASDYGEDWLPNFGRVWQEGTRKDSRKEFEREKHHLSRHADLQETTLQPYISKKKRLDPGGNGGDGRI